jgi:hypothetical protein
MEIADILTHIISFLTPGVRKSWSTGRESWKNFESVARVSWGWRAVCEYLAELPAAQAIACSVDYDYLTYPRLVYGRTILLALTRWTLEDLFDRGIAYLEEHQPWCISESGRSSLPYISFAKKEKGPYLMTWKRALIAGPCYGRRISESREITPSPRNMGRRARIGTSARRRILKAWGLL